MVAIIAMGFAKNPVDVLREKKFDSLEVADALRLAIIAELDAISLYLQLAKYVDDERARKVFEDVAREEKAHFGEFLAVLKTYDPDLAAELKAGAEEVREKTGLEAVDPPAAGGGWIEEVAAAAREAVSSARRFRKHLAVYQAGPGTAAVVVGGAVVPIRELGVKFSIPYRQVEEALRSGGKPYFAEAAAAAAKLAAMEDSAVAEVLLNGGKVLKASSWDAPGSAVAEAAKAVAELYRAYAPEPYMLFVGPSRYAKLVAVEERTGVMELTRVKSLVKDVVVVPQLPDDAALLMSTSPAVVDLAVGVDSETTYLGPDEAGHNFLLRETFAVRLKNPEGVVVLRQ
jgi:uncharacterized linocin/CFP29 family protein